MRLLALACATLLLASCDRPMTSVSELMGRGFNSIQLGNPAALAQCPAGTIWSARWLARSDATGELVGGVICIDRWNTPTVWIDEARP